MDLDANVVGPWICERTGGKWSPVDSVAMGWRGADGELSAGMLVDHWNGASCAAHIAITAPLARQFIRFCFGYLFGQLKAKKVIGLVAASNTKALKLDKHLGFIEEYRIKDGHPDGDLVILTMTPAQCRWFGRPYGGKILSSCNA